MNLRYFPERIASGPIYEAQKVTTNDIAVEWKQSVQKEIERNAIPMQEMVGYIPDAMYIASNPKWKNEPFGAASTMEESACIVFTAKYMMDYYGEKISMVDFKNLVVMKGYRAWKFKNAPKVFYTPEATRHEAMIALNVPTSLQECGLAKVAWESLGSVTGVGGVHSLIDNIISYYSGVEAIKETRLRTVTEFYSQLCEKKFVPVLVTNSIYWDNSERKGRHFVLVVGIENGEAIVFDSSVGERRLPITQLLQATNVAWKVCPKR